MPDADFETSVWDAFDETLERASEQLSDARDNKRVVDFTDKSLPEIYTVALQEVDATIDEFDSVYDVSQHELKEAQKVASQANLLVEVTAAYRKCYESMIHRRVVIAVEWSKKLEEALEDTGTTVEFDRTTLSKQRQVLEKFVGTERYGQLLSSDRISLDGFESGVKALNDQVCNKLEPSEYIGVGEAIINSLTNEYTSDLSDLTDKDIETSTISVADRLNQSPDIESILDRSDRNRVSEEDATMMSEAIQVYTEVAKFTGRQRARYILGADLISTIDTSSLFEYGETSELRSYLSKLDVETIASAVSAVIEREVTTPEDERFRQLLSEHGGSVRRTERALDTSTEEIFELLRELYLSGDIADLEAEFE